MPSEVIQTPMTGGPTVPSSANAWIAFVTSSRANLKNVVSAVMSSQVKE
jgi:hypothetical protein